jgi:hypothetical protein
MSQFDWPIAKEKLKLWSASPFDPAIQVRRGGLWAKHMGLKQGAISENPWGI